MQSVQPCPLQGAWWDSESSLASWQDVSGKVGLGVGILSLALGVGVMAGVLAVSTPVAVTLAVAGVGAGLLEAGIAHRRGELAEAAGKHEFAEQRYSERNMAGLGLALQGLGKASGWAIGKVASKYGNTSRLHQEAAKAALETPYDAVGAGIAGGGALEAEVSSGNPAPRRPEGTPCAPPLLPRKEPSGDDVRQMVEDTDRPEAKVPATRGLQPARRPKL